MWYTKSLYSPPQGPGQTAHLAAPSGFNPIVSSRPARGTAFQGGPAMLKKLRWKFVLLIMVLLSAVLGTALALQTGSALRQYREETDRVLRAALARGEAVLDPGHALLDGSPVRDDELYTGIPAFCAAVDREGRVLLALSYNAALDGDTLTRALEAALDAGVSSGQLRELNLRYLIQPKGPWLELAFADLSWEQSAVRRQVLTACLIFAGALAGFFTVSVLLSRWLMRPVEESWRVRQQFVADASHELKTPLTVLLADADILLSRPEETVGSQRQWVEGIREEGLRMKGLVQDLLFLARGDAAGDVRPRERVDLSALCEGCVMSFEPVAFEAGLTLDSAVAPGVAVTGSGEELRRLCAILLDNACKYCQPGGTVTVTLAAGERAVLTVHNTGEPIPQEALPHLFERFYRADAARSRQTGGAGLGLSIAAAIAERCRGRITVHSAQGEGTAFTAVLPLDRQLGERREKGG